MSSLATRRRARSAPQSDGVVLDVSGLTVEFVTQHGWNTVVDGVDLSVRAGRTHGLVGESGSGKSVTSLAIMGLIPSPPGRITGGSIRFQGKELLGAGRQELDDLRGDSMSMIFQEPMTSLNPAYTVGEQIAETVRRHRAVTRRQARERAVEMLGLVGIPRPASRVSDYPHSFSGGMRQRVMIAMALVNDPKLLIADEPTTALDVTVQAQILELLVKLRSELDTAIIIITHDLGVVAQMADDIAVMYSGRIVEHAPAQTIFSTPEHPYTWGLLKSIPRLDVPRDEELVPISGRPPSLINRPSGCHFHPRCPYVRESHRQVDPQLVGEGDHLVRCLLPSETRKRLWAELRAGADPQQARERVPLPEEVTP